MQSLANTLTLQRPHRRQSKARYQAHRRLQLPVRRLAPCLDLRSLLRPLPRRPWPCRPWPGPWLDRCHKHLPQLLPQLLLRLQHPLLPRLQRLLRVQ